MFPNSIYVWSQIKFHWLQQWQKSLGGHAENFAIVDVNVNTAGNEVWMFQIWLKLFPKNRQTPCGGW